MMDKVLLSVQNLYQNNANSSDESLNFWMIFFDSLIKQPSVKTENNSKVNLSFENTQIRYEQGRFCNARGFRLNLGRKSTGNHLNKASSISFKSNAVSVHLGTVLFLSPILTHMKLLNLGASCIVQLGHTLRRNIQQDNMFKQKLLFSNKWRINFYSTFLKSHKKFNH